MCVSVQDGLRVFVSLLFVFYFVMSGCCLFVFSLSFLCFFAYLYLFCLFCFALCLSDISVTQCIIGMYFLPFLTLNPCAGA